MKHATALKNGFTLIELLVVVVIIGILASVAAMEYQKTVWQTRASEAWSGIQAINAAEKLKNMEEGTADVVYPFAALSLVLLDKDGASPEEAQKDLQVKDYLVLHTPSGAGEDFASATLNVNGKSAYLSIRKGRRLCFEDSESMGVCQSLGFETQSTDCLMGSTIKDEGCYSE